MKPTEQLAQSTTGAMTKPTPVSADADPDPHAMQLPVMRSAGITLLGSAIGGVLVISNEILAAHFMKVQAYGLYASGMTVARFGEVLAVFGLPVALFHFIPAYRQQRQRELVVGAVLAAGLLPLLIGGAVAIAIWFMAPWLALDVFRTADATPYIRILAVAIPFMAWSEILGAVTRAFGYAKYYVIVRNLVPPVMFLAIMGMIAWLGMLPIWITAAMVLSYFLACIVGIRAVAGVVGSDLWHVKPVYPVRTLYGYSAGIMMNSFLYVIFALTGTFTIAIFLGSDSVGIYRVCLQVVVPFDMVLLAFHAAMGPIYPGLAKEEDPARLEEAYGTAVRWMAILLLPLGIVLAWNARDFLNLLGPGFSEGATALTILAIGYSTCTCFGTVAYLLMLSGRKSTETLNAAFATLTNVVLCVLLVPRFGIAGAAFATATAFFLLNVLRIWEARYMVRLRTFRPYLLRVVAVSAGAALLSFSILQWSGTLQGADAVSILARIVIVGVLQVAAMWSIGLNAKDKDMLVTLATSLSKRRAPMGGPM